MPEGDFWTTSKIVMKLSIDIHGPQWIVPSDFGDPPDPSPRATLRSKFALDLCQVYWEQDRKPESPWNLSELWIFMDDEDREYPPPGQNLLSMFHNIYSAHLSSSEDEVKRLWWPIDRFSITSIRPQFPLSAHQILNYNGQVIMKCTEHEGYQSII